MPDRSNARVVDVGQKSRLRPSWSSVVIWETLPTALSAAVSDRPMVQCVSTSVIWATRQLE